MPRYQYAQPYDLVRSIRGNQTDIRDLQVRSAGVPDIWHYVGDPTTGLGTAFGSGWSNLGSGWANLAFKKVAANRIEIIGAVTVGAAGSTVLTLPTGYIPVSQQSLMYFVVAGNTGSTSNAPLLNVLTSGAVVQNGNTTPGASAAWIHDTYSLDV